jgi:hypothetical protein
VSYYRPRWVRNSAFFAAELSWFVLIQNESIDLGQVDAMIGRSKCFNVSFITRRRQRCQHFDTSPSADQPCHSTNSHLPRLPNVGVLPKLMPNELERIVQRIRAVAFDMHGKRVFGVYVSGLTMFLVYC